MENFYKKIKKDDQNSMKNPNFNVHHMEAPFRLIIVGASGSGKTNTSLNIINAFAGTFYNIIIVTKNADEPLYNFLKEKLNGRVQILEGVLNVPKVDEFNKKEPSLVIFDDLVLDDQRRIADFYIRCRKLNVSVMFLSQAYFLIDKVIRQNVNYIILKRVSSMRNLRIIASDFGLSADADKIIRLYKSVISSPDIVDFFMIDCIKSQFRKNFEVINEGVDL